MSCNLPSQSLVYLPMNYDELVYRCYTEIIHSTSLPMLEVAMKYFELFRNLLIRKHVEKKIIDTLTDTMNKAYRRKRKKFDEYFLE